MDFGIILFPLVTGVIVFGIAVGSSDTMIVFEPISVPPMLYESGYESGVFTRQLADSFAEIDRGAGSVLREIDIDQSYQSQSLERISEYFEIGQLVTATRQYFGLIPYYMQGEVVEHDEGLALTLHAESNLGRRAVLTVLSPDGSVDELIERGAAAAMGFVNPYLLLLYTRRQEEAAGDLDFPRTRELIQYCMNTLPNGELDIVHNSWGQMLRIQGNPNEAMRHFLLAVDIDPTFVFPYINMGSALAEAGRMDEAVGWWRRSIELNPNEDLVHVRWAQAHYAIDHNISAAIRQMEFAIVKDPTVANYYFTTGGYYEELGDLASAYDYYRRANEIDRSNRDYEDAFLRLAPAPNMP